MRAALTAALLMLVPAFAFPGAQASVVPDAVADVLLRNDEDGNRTAVLFLEDGRGGSFTYTVVRTPNGTPDAREVGAYEHQWTHNAAPMRTLGVYARTDSEGIVRVPLVTLENIAPESAGLLDFASTLALGSSWEPALILLPFLLEYAAPSLSTGLSDPPEQTRGITQTYHDSPPAYVWLVHRTISEGELWVGLGVHQEGHRTESPLSAERTTTVGVATRKGDSTTIEAGAYLTNRMSGGAAGPDHVASDALEAGAVASDARIPLAFLHAHDRREGASYGTTPDAQHTRLTLGAFFEGEELPLIGTETSWYEVASPFGNATTRITSFGTYVDGHYVPLAGLRTHSDRRDIPLELIALALGGPGGGAGNFEIQFGTFEDRDFLPLVTARHRTSFPGALMGAEMLIAIDIHGNGHTVSPLAVTYEAPVPAYSWVLTQPQPGSRVRIAAGIMIDDEYLPVVGVEHRATTPTGTRASQREVVVGTFVGGYEGFVPLASYAHDGDQDEASFALDQALGGGPGAESGDADITLGTHTPIGYQPVIGFAARDSSPDGGNAGAEMMVGIYDTTGAFVPLAGARYEGEEPIIHSARAAGNLTDDTPSRTRVGVYAFGTFVPVLTLANDGQQTTLMVGPGLSATPLSSA